MKLTTIKEKILNSVIITERIVGKKESLPILSCLLLTVGKEISIRATNLEAGIDMSVPGDIEEGGSVAVSASVFSQTLRSIGGEKISLKEEGGNLVIESRGTRTLIKAVPYEDFPELSLMGGDKKGVSISREVLMRGMQDVAYAASPSMIRPELGSVYISIKPTEVVCAATDSFRLSEKRMKAHIAYDGGEILIPLKHAVELIHVLERLPDESVSLLTDNSQLLVIAGGMRFTSRVIDGIFPNYQEIIPKTFTTTATVLKNDLVETLRKARVFSGNDQHVGLHLYPKRKIFSATAQNPDVGEMSDSIDAAISGEDIDINFHIGYLSDCLPTISTDSVVLGFSGVGKPLVIRGVSDDSFTYLVMPLNR